MNVRTEKNVLSSANLPPIFPHQLCSLYQKIRRVFTGILIYLFYIPAVNPIACASITQDYYNTERTNNHLYIAAISYIGTRQGIFSFLNPLSFTLRPQASLFLVLY